jgi:hypothetical protein
MPTKDSYTRNTTHCGKYCSLKPEPGGVGITVGLKRSRRKQRPATRDNNIIIIINISRLTKVH